MKNLYEVLHGMPWIIFGSLPDFVQVHLKEVGLTQLRDRDTFKISQLLIYYNLLCRRAHMNMIVRK